MKETKTLEALKGALAGKAIAGRICEQIAVSAKKLVDQCCNCNWEKNSISELEAGQLIGGKFSMEEAQWKSFSWVFLRSR